VVGALWTQSIHVHWPRSFAFLERRFSLLRRLEEHEELTGHRTADEEIGVRFRGNAYRVDVDSISVTISCVASAFDEDFVRQILDIVLESVEPRSLESILALYQHLTPQVGSAQELQAATATAILGDWTKPASLLDYSISADGTSEGAKLHVDFGIVSEAEIPERLARRAWTVAAEPRDAEMVRYWKRRDLPSAATYVGCDWYWTDFNAPDATAEVVLDAWSRGETATERIATSVNGHVGEPPKR
jgi:hypothetical protein